MSKKVMGLCLLHSGDKGCYGTCLYSSHKRRMVLINNSLLSLMLFVAHPLQTNTNVDMEVVWPERG